MIAAALRAAWGTALLAVPDRVLRVAGCPPTSSARWVLRALGVRQVVQAVACRRARDADVALAIGAVVDAAHATSCLAIACLSPVWRRAAVIDLAIAAALAANAVAAIRRR
ncbi:hypothetical protein ACFFS4_43070 [Kutzneria kofuensis]|uniref:hypothetical protein n=1 Tax=Kutzneria kofuensis TaxID=103725 RepID=UPI0035E79CF3